MSESPNSQNKKEKFNWINLLIWLVLAFFIRWQVIEPRWIPSGSMLPTLQLQDRILVEKLRPRIKRAQGNHLKHESVIVFKPPEKLINSGYSSDKALIKRLIGLPGDQLEIKNGQLFRNGKLIEETWRENPIEYEMEKIIIPESQLWVLGDNRNNSLDSHFWGALPEENVIGTAVWRYWPPKSFGPIRFPTQKRIEKETVLRYGQ